MEYAITAAITAVVAGGIGALLSYLLRSRNTREQEKSAQTLLDEAKRSTESARKEAEVKARDELLAAREALDAEGKELRKEIGEQQKRIVKREDILDSKLSLLDKKEDAAEKAQRRAQEMQKEAEGLRQELSKKIDEQLQELQRVGRLSRDEARKELLQRVEESIRGEAAELVRRSLERAKTEAEDQAKSVVLDSVHRLATDIVADNVVSSISLPSDDMKGRIIGREGRNIRAFEKATGMDVIVDDTPGVVVVSGFDPVRRAIGRLAMQKLVADGRIHPTRIEDVVKKTEAEVQKDIDETGRRTIQEFGIHNLSGRLTKLMGRLKYRTSYGQNCLQHSIEVAHVSSMLAEELKLDPKVATRAGLLHDIGKAIDHDTEGTHQALGADLLKRSDEKPVIVNAVEAHHEDVPVESLYGVIVQTADAISAARPGARRESFEKYVKRLEALETIATTHKGIEKAYAIQAGRELRVIAKAEQLDEPACAELARDIAKQIEAELNYPGEVKVTLVRENRFTEYAR
ncbi:MAG: ribonuclease Y [Planctomycetota bacterium]|jgi:ribonuclease Y